MMSPNTTKYLAVVALFSLSGLSCAQIFGLDEGEKAPSRADAGGGMAGSGGTAGTGGTGISGHGGTAGGQRR